MTSTFRIGGDLEVRRPALGVMHLPTAARTARTTRKGC